MIEILCFVLIVVDALGVIVGVDVGGIHSCDADLGGVSAAPTHLVDGCVDVRGAGKGSFD